MKYRAIATDYDGTLAYEGRVDLLTLDAIRAARAHGVRLVLVTGRELSDLFNTFERADIFDRIVAENGAVLYDPATRQVTTLAAAPPPALIEVLTREQIPISVGHSIVATVEPHADSVLSAIHDLVIDWHVIFNKGSVMALPADVTKATGLLPALDALHLTPNDAIGIGDAENDEAFLGICGVAVAVANALPAVKEMADVVTSEARGAGVAQAIRMLLAGELDTIPPRSARDPGAATRSQR
jgi:hydroxymethylpyrimidine pyrophosphatase-like HAD family hydrolase